MKKRVNVHGEMEKTKGQRGLGALTKLALDQKAAWAREAEEEAEADARVGVLPPRSRSPLDRA